MAMGKLRRGAVWGLIVSWVTQTRSRGIGGIAPARVPGPITPLAAGASVTARLFPAVGSQAATRGHLLDPRQRLQSRGPPALALDAHGHRGATHPSSRLLPARLCPPPKISPSSAVPSPAAPRSRGSSANARSSSSPIPPAARGKGMQHPPPPLASRSPATGERARPGILSHRAKRSPRACRRHLLRLWLIRRWLMTSSGSALAS